MIQQSIYTHIFRRDGRFFVYNSHHSLFAEISEALYEVLYNRDYASLPEDVVKDLLGKGVLCDDSEQSNYYSEELVKFYAAANNNTEMSLVLVPTTGCNFDCPYCFEGEKQSHVMSEEVQDSIVRHIETSHLLEKVHITWYGGEPLLAFSVMKSLYKKIVNLKSITLCGHSLITNGYLITDEVLDFINQTNLNDIQITLDGVKANHDKTRCLRGTDTPTFDRIVDNIGNILNTCPSVRLSIRVNVNKHNSGDFFEMYKFLHDKYESNRLTVYPGFIREDTPDNCSLCYSSMSYVEMFDMYKDLYDKGIDVQFMPKLVKKRGCIMHQVNSFVIGPQGELYKCWNDVNHHERIIGNIDSKAIGNRGLFYHLLTETHPFADIKCKGCLLFPVCSGGCGWYRSRNVKSNGDYDVCTIHKNLNILEESLLLSFKKNNNKVYKQKIRVV